MVSRNETFMENNVSKNSLVLQRARNENMFQKIQMEKVNKNTYILFRSIKKHFSKNKTK